MPGISGMGPWLAASSSFDGQPRTDGKDRPGLGHRGQFFTARHCAGTDDGAGDLTTDGPDGLQGHRRAQGDLQHADAAGKKSPCQGHRLLQFLV